MGGNEQTEKFTASYNYLAYCVYEIFKSCHLKTSKSIPRKQKQTKQTKTRTANFSSLQCNLYVASETTLHKHSGFTQDLHAPTPGRFRIPADVSGDDSTEHKHSGYVSVWGEASLFFVRWQPDRTAPAERLSEGLNGTQHD